MRCFDNTLLFHITHKNTSCTAKSFSNLFDSKTEMNSGCKLQNPKHKAHIPHTPFIHLSIVCSFILRKIGTRISILKMEIGFQCLKHFSKLFGFPCC